MRQLLWAAKAIDAITAAIGRTMWWVSLLMVLVGVYNVLTRYLYGPLERIVGQDLAARMTGNFYLEIQTLSYDMIFLLGAAFVWRLDGHVRVDIIFSNLGPRARTIVDLVGTWLMAVPFFVIGLMYSLPYVQRSWRALEVSPNPGGLPRYPIKALILVAFALLLLQAISLTIRHIAFLMGRKDSGSPHAPRVESSTSDAGVETAGATDLDSAGSTVGSA